MAAAAPQFLFRLLYLIERVAARAQGKGYGSASLAHEVRQLSSLLAAEPVTAIDVGGNLGNYTAELRRAHAELEIHTFEPSPINVAKLRQRFKDDKRVIIVPFALADSVGVATLYANSPGSGMGSLTQRRLDHFNVPFDSTEEVHLIRFEDYWRDALSARRLDLVKIDVEGHELQVLRGFGAALSAVGVLQFEFGGCNIDTRSYFQDFWYYFKERNFDLYRITPLGPQKIRKYKELDETFMTTNYLAVNTDWTPRA